MSQYSVVPYVIERLKEIPELKDATVVEDYTMPSICRPILKTVISVGAKDSVMTPTTRVKHAITYTMRLTFLFPCGLKDSHISETLYRVSAAFVGRIFYHFVVESAEAGTPVFNSDLYGVKIELLLKMRLVDNVMDPSETGQSEMYFINNVALDRFPEKIYEKRGNEDGVVSICPRTFILEGNSAHVAAGDTWNSLHTLMANDTPFDFSLPRSDKTVKVKPCSIETEGDLCGFGFKYKLTFTEVL